VIPIINRRNIMTITKTSNGNEVTLTLEGWLETQAAPLLGEKVDSLEDGTASLILDMHKLEYISSAGLRQLVAAHKKMNGALTLRGVSPEIMEILRMAGFDKRLHIEE